jgi:sterile alpha motif and leucine zipper-containing kinase AZK
VKFPSGDWRYVAPECFDTGACLRSDVFSFGLILYELIVGQPAFSVNLAKPEIARMLIVDRYRPDIPIGVDSSVADLIADCWAEDWHCRPYFKKIVKRLKGMEFKVMPGVQSSKIAKFVAEVEAAEIANDAPP